MNLQERTVIERVLNKMEADGLYFEVNDGDEDLPKSDVKGTLNNIDGVDEAWINVFSPNQYVGQLFLVFGNSPDEVICDFSCSLDKYLVEYMNAP